MLENILRDHIDDAAELVLGDVYNNAFLDNVEYKINYCLNTIYDVKVNYGIYLEDLNNAYEILTKNELENINHEDNYFKIVDGVVDYQDEKLDKLIDVMIKSTQEINSKVMEIGHSILINIEEDF